MANDTNIVVLVGRLTRESELKFTNNGTAVGRFSLAVNRMKRSGEQREEEVSFFDIVVWGKQAEVLNPYLTKGRQVCINGELRQNRWEQDGQSRSRIEVVANNIQLLGGSSGNNSTSSTADYSSSNDQGNRRTGGFEPKGNSRMPSAPNGFPGPEQFDDDIPF
ncbi:MAG: single-stranded DNA-binding protein [Sphaerochaeta sp.]|jgi:single-strand DNA-binding protein|nr:single-stranded DNA-binding protein [Sphaerochaeta sp.]PKL29640.1 MAG: single-stranded DNA-binding protein [Spirochaetae bacterium HGW-Spirochaetae-2]